MTDLRPFTTVAPPPAQGLMVAYLTPILSPTPVATRLPQPNKTDDTINNFLRVESAGGSSSGPDQILFDVSVILHAYCVNTQESQGEQLLANALAWAGNAQGLYITHASTQVKYFVTYSRITSLGVKQPDPQVAMTRFRGMVTWTIHGIPLPRRD